MLVKTHDHVLAANDHRHAARTRDSDHFIQSVAVFADIKLNVLDSLSRKELLRLATVVSSREAVNLDLLHSRLLLLGFMLLVCLPAFGVRFHVNFITSPATRQGSACVKSDAKSVSQRIPFETLPSEPGTICGVSFPLPAPGPVDPLQGEANAVYPPLSVSARSPAVTAYS